jgi:hypothetical protein
MKKIKRLNLNAETVRVLGARHLTGVAGGGSLDAPCPSHACPATDGCQTGGGGSGSLNTCFIGNCQTIVSQ